MERKDCSIKKHLNQPMVVRFYPFGLADSTGSMWKQPFADSKIGTSKEGSDTL